MHSEEGKVGVMRRVVRKIIPFRIRWQIRHIVLGAPTSERGYLDHSIIPELGVPDRFHWNNYKMCARYIPEGASVLDAGCGSGCGSYFFAQKALRVVAFDYSKDALIFAKKHNSAPNIVYIRSDVDKFNYPDKFDIIFMLEFIEHHNNPRKVLDRMYSFLKKGGVMFVSTPRCPKGTGLTEGWHLFQFTDARLKEVFDGYDYEVRGYKDTHGEDNISDPFVEVKRAPGYFITVRAK